MRKRDAVHMPVAHRQIKVLPNPTGNRLRFQQRDWAVRIQRINQTVASIGNDHQIARLIRNQIDRFEWIIADGGKLPRRRIPKLNTLPEGSHEIEIAMRLHRAAGDVEKVAGEFFNLGTASYDG